MSEKIALLEEAIVRCFGYRRLSIQVASLRDLNRPLPSWRTTGLLVFLYYFVLPSLNKVFILSYLILSCLILSYLILSYLILSYLILSYLILSYLILSYLILSYLILSYLILSYLVLSYLILRYLILTYLRSRHPNISSSKTINVQMRVADRFIIM